jgi:hypothetical protein
VSSMFKSTYTHINLHAIGLKHIPFQSDTLT